MGRRVQDGREVFGAFFYPRAFQGTDSTSTVLLVWTLDRSSNPADNFGSSYVLSAVTDPGPAAGEPSVRRLVAGNPSGGGCQFVPTDGCASMFDSRGRMLVYTAPAPEEASMNRPGGGLALTRIDPLTGDAQLLTSSAGSFQLSPSGERLVYATLGDARQFETRLREADDSEIVLGTTSVSYLFQGEDLYSTDDNRALQRLPPGGPAQIVASDVRSLQALPPPVSHLMTLSRYKDTQDSSPSDFQMSILDTTTGRETPFSLLPFGPVFPSPDGRWLLYLSSISSGMGATPIVQASQVVLMDLGTGSTETAMLPDVMYLNGSPWRPGSDEAWLASPSNDRFWIVRPGQAPVEVPRGLRDYQQVGFQKSSPFTDDGVYFFRFVQGQLDGPGQTFAVPASDPLVPGVRLHPEGTTSYFYQSLPDGELLISAFYVQSDRNDLFLVDPATGARRLLAETGALVAVGKTRLLATQHCLYQDGCDLTLVELASGATTRIAESVGRVFVEDDASGDPLASGRRIGFTVGGMYPSPYDGLWVTLLP